jgi:hypothetical protein
VKVDSISRGVLSNKNTNVTQVSGRICTYNTHCLTVTWLVHTTDVTKYITVLFKIRQIMIICFFLYMDNNKFEK